MKRIAIILKNLKTHVRVDRILDALFEDIIVSMELNDFKDSQRRISVITFVGEAYNYKLISTDTLLDILYKLINYDYWLKSHDEYLVQLDRDPIDSFRIRLVCTLLDTIDLYFGKGLRKTLMDRFLLFF